MLPIEPRIGPKSSQLVGALLISYKSQAITISLMDYKSVNYSICICKTIIGYVNYL